MSIFSETSGANRGVMILAAVAVIGIFVGALSFATNLVKKNSPQLAVATTTTTDVVLPTGGGSSSSGYSNAINPPTSKPPATYFPQTTTTTLTPQQARLQYPEGSVLAADQLAYRYNQANSGLTPAAYQQATDVTKRFVLAEATGQGVEDFHGYFSNLPADPWVKNYTFVYATAVQTSSPTLVKGIIWYKGIEKASGLPMTQVKEGIFMTRSTNSSLDFAPVQLDAPSQDKDYGIHIIP